MVSPRTRSPNLVRTPEDLVFRADSDSKSIVLLIPREGGFELVYAREGLYGGYVLKPAPQDPEALVARARAFFVEPKIERVEREKLPGEARRAIEEAYAKMPPEVREEFERSAKYELVRYRFVEVQPTVRKVTEKYAVLDFQPKPGGVKAQALAARAYIHWQGSARHPEYTTASKVYREWALKYPDNPVIQNQVYPKNYTGYRGRGSTIYLKVVVEAPRELLPGAATPRTAAGGNEAKKGSVIEELRRLAQELEEETEEIEEPRVSKEEVLRYLETKGLKRVRLVTFDLPTEYRGAKTLYEKDDGGVVREVKVFSRDPTRYRSLRRKFYSILEESAYKTTAGWVLLSSADLGKLNEVIEELNKLAGTDRTVWIIEAWLPKDWVEQQLESYIRAREMSLKKLVEKLKTEKLKESEKKRLQKRIEKLQEIIEKLKQEIEK